MRGWNSRASHCWGCTRPSVWPMLRDASHALPERDLAASRPLLIPNAEYFALARKIAGPRRSATRLRSSHRYFPSDCFHMELALAPLPWYEQSRPKPPARKIAIGEPNPDSGERGQKQLGGLRLRRTRGPLRTWKYLNLPDISELPRNVGVDELTSYRSFCRADCTIVTTAAHV
jgi:hypothetical protein